MYNKCIINTFCKNYENDVSYLALKSTRTTSTITCLNISKNLKKKVIYLKWKQ